MTVKRVVLRGTRRERRTIKTDHLLIPFLGAL